MAAGRPEAVAEPGPIGAPAFRRILLKLSGEGLQADGLFQHPDKIGAWARQIRDARAAGVDVAVVVGGGNIFRGLSASRGGMDRATGDYAGMLSTVLNGLAIQDALEKLGVYTRMQSALTIEEVAEPYIRRRAIRHLEKGRVVIFVGGTGNPYFTTDTAGALRACEIGAQALLMGKHGVDGVYDDDPHTNPDAVFLPNITHREALERGLDVMDATALALCMENDLPIYVFNLDEPANISRILAGQRIGTLVSSGAEAADLRAGEPAGEPLFHDEEGDPRG
jgi:uridylate kinase